MTKLSSLVGLMILAIVGLNVSPAEATGESTTTTPSETTTTQEPYDTAVRGSQVEEEPYPDPCIIDGVRYDAWIAVGWPKNEGTTEWGFIPCSRPPATPLTNPPVEVEETPVATGVPRPLPVTGPANVPVIIIGLLAVALGILCVWWARRIEEQE